MPSLGEPEGAQPLPTTQVEPARHRWTVTRDLVDYESALEVVKDLGVVRFDEIDLEVTRRAVERYSWVADDVTSVRGETTWSMGFARGDWQIRTETRTVLTSTETTFRVHAELDAYQGSERVFEHSWRSRSPRPRLTAARCCAPEVSAHADASSQGSVRCCGRATHIQPQLTQLGLMPGSRTAQSEEDAPA